MRLPLLLQRQKAEAATRKIHSWQPQRVLLSHGRCFDADADKVIRRIFGEPPRRQRPVLGHSIRTDKCPRIEPLDGFGTRVACKREEVREHPVSVQFRKISSFRDHDLILSRRNTDIFQRPHVFRSRGGWEMDETASKVPVTEEKAPERPTESQTWRPFESLRREVYRLFEDFDRDRRRPLRPRLSMSTRSGGVS